MLHHTNRMNVMTPAHWKLTFSPSVTIRELQQEFQKRYHWLKIEFYSIPHSISDKKVSKNMFSSGKSLQEIGYRLPSVTIEIDDKMSVKELEEIIHKKTGLYAQVFRKSGKIWLETSATDNWTLGEQNEEAEALQKQLKQERENPEDHDIW